MWVYTELSNDLVYALKNKILLKVVWTRDGMFHKYSNWHEHDSKDQVVFVLHNKLSFHNRFRGPMDNIIFVLRLFSLRPSSLHAQ